MADPNPPTPSCLRGAVASSFETTASTPSSRVETPSPGRKNNSINAKLISSAENKNKNKKKEGNETEHTYNIGDITMKDDLEAGPSRTKTTRIALCGISTAVSGNSDCEIVETATAASETSTATRTRRGKRRRTDVMRDSDESITDNEIRQTIRKDTLDALTSLSASTIASRAFEWISTIDDLRARSRNIQDSVSGNMKRNLTQIKRAITILLARVHATGDLRHLKKKIEEQSFEILNLQAKLQNALRNEQYYREQSAEFGVSTTNLMKRPDKPLRKAALKSRIANQVGRNVETEASSDDIFATPFALPLAKETREGSVQEFPLQKPEGISPERWRKIQRRNETVDSSHDTYKETTNMAELKVFIKQQINEAITGIKSGMHNKIDINSKGNLKGSRLKSVKTYVKPKTSDLQRVNDEIRRRESCEDSETMPPGRSTVSWAEVTVRPKKPQSRRDPARKRVANPIARLNKNPPRVKIPRLAAVSIHCKDKKDYPRVLGEAKERINLKEIGITETTVGRSFSGALMILIPREDEKENSFPTPGGKVDGTHGWTRRD